MIACLSTQAKVLSVVCVSLLLVACGESGPKPPQPGTPAFHWLMAKEAYKTGDFAKANDLLVRVSESGNENTEQARPWALVMSLGLAKSYLELSEKYDEGAKRNRTDPTPLRRATSEYKTKAAAAALQFAEIAHRHLDASKDKDVSFVFDLPQASMEDPVQYKKITAGLVIQESERLGAEKEVVRREVVRNACRALKAEKDIEKAKAAYQAGEAKVQGQAFVLMVGKGLHEVSEMFGPKKLDQPQRLKAIYTEALEALGMVKDSKEAKELIRKIGDSKKKYKLT